MSDIIGKMKAIFLDRDGTINVGVPVYERVDKVDKLKLLPTVMEALTKLASMDYGVFFITNQAGIAEGLITEAAFQEINKKLLEMITPSGIRILKTYYCPHGESAVCDCRKPKPKMLLDAAKEYDIDLRASWTVGDRHTDVETGANAGTRTILVQSGAAVDASKTATYTAPNLLNAIEYIANHAELN